MTDRDVWAELRHFVEHMDEGVVGIGRSATRRPGKGGRRRDWSVHMEFGREAPDSPMAGGAAYGADEDLEVALAQALDDLSAHSRGLADAPA